MTSLLDFEYYTLYSCLGRGDSREQVLRQFLGTECEYHNHVSRLYMTKEDFQDRMSKIKFTGLPGDLDT